MGSGYSALSTVDDSEFMSMTFRESTGMCRSLTFNDKLPVVRESVHSDTINAICPVRPGMVLTGSSDKSIVLNNMDNGEAVCRWRGHSQAVTKVVYKLAQTKHYVISASRDSTIKLFTFNDADAVQTYDSHSLSVTALANLEDHFFVSGSRDTSVKLFDVTRTECVRSVSTHGNLSTHLVRIPKTTLVCQTSEDQMLKVYDAHSLEIVHSFPAKGHTQLHCSASPDGNYCLATSAGTYGDGCDITVYDVRMMRVLQSLRGHEESVRCAIFVQQSIVKKQMILSLSDDWSIRLWTMEDAKCVWKDRSYTGYPFLTGTAFSDGTVVVAGLHASLALMRLNGRASFPFLHYLSVQCQGGLPTSSSAHALR